MRWKLFACLAGLGLLSCAVGPNYLSSTPALSSSFASAAEQTEPPVVTSESGDLASWWRAFDDPTLTTLVDEALHSNLGLALAQARVRQAEAQKGVSAGPLYPSVTATLAYERQSGPEFVLGGGSRNLYQSELSAAWGIDLFGAVRRSVESAEANVEAAIQATRETAVGLAAQVALDYVELRGFQQESKTARDNLVQQQKTAEITRKLYKVGFDSGLDIANAESLVASTEAQIPVFETGARQSIFALSVLLGKEPGTLVERLSPEGDVPPVPATIPAGAPSELVHRRPDVREAEAQLHAATAEVGVAQAALLPQFTVAGGAGFESSTFSSWWNSQSFSYFVGPSLSWPIFQGFAGVENVHVEEALREQARLTYEQAVLTATEDVENALTAFANERQHQKSLRAAVAADHKAVDLSLKLYTAGQTDFLNVLTAEKTLFTDELAQDESTESLAADVIALYLALGGGCGQGAEC
jgi:outer membrane protein, multidrug efflux system